MRAIIIGGGIGGLCAARAMTQLGADAAVFERSSSQERSEVGGAITVWWNAVRGLAQLNLAAAVIEAGTVLNRVEFTTDRGRRIVAWDLTALNRTLETPTMAISRTDLYRAVLGALPPGLVHYNSNYRRFEQDARGVRVEFSDGRVERGDLLIAADGLRSKIREELVGIAAPRFAGYSVWQAQLSTPSVWQRHVPHVESPEHGIAFHMQWGRGARFSWGHLKSGMNWAAFLKSKEGPVHSIEGMKAMLSDRCRHFAAPAGDLIAVTPDTAISRRDIYDRQPLDRWGIGRVTLLGDAAHPMTQDVGQGAAQAIEDAVVLARSLESAASIEQGLREYERVRMRRTAMITRSSRTWAGVAMWNNPVGCIVRNQFLRLTLSGLGRRMTVRQILSGV
jgi:2-polyprenyl-6-methoxyphenol hydroxylase-like FAD-dependent oxidoreductase